MPCVTCRPSIEDALEEVDAQRAAGGIVHGVVYVGVSHAEAALVVDVAEIARQALVLGG